MNILLFNFLLFLVPVFILLYRDRAFNINVFLLLVYAFFALAAVLIIDEGIYTWQKYQRVELSIWPYLFFHICFWIFILPIWRINSSDFQIQLTKQQFSILFYSGSFFYIAAILINAKDAFSISNVMDTYLYAGETRGGIKAWSSNLANLYTIPMNMLAFYTLSKKSKNVWIAIFLFLLIVLEGYIRMQNYASRGIAYFLFGDLFISFLLFSNSIEKKIKRIIFLFIPLLFLVFISAILLISEARFGSDKMFIWILSYFGEPFINFGTIFWDSPKFFNGEYLLGALFGFGTPTSPIPLYLFKTFAGSIYLDFSIVGSIVFLMFLAMIQSLVLKNVSNKRAIIHFRDVMVYFIVVKIVFSGIFTFFIFPYYNYIGWVFFYFVLLGRYRFVLFKKRI